VENHVVGAPCGVMDQMTSACGEANKLLAMVCQVSVTTSAIIRFVISEAIVYVT
jgi:galactokinase